MLAKFCWKLQLQKLGTSWRWLWSSPAVSVGSSICTVVGKTSGSQTREWCDPVFSVIGDGTSGRCYDLTIDPLWGQWTHKAFCSRCKSKKMDHLEKSSNNAMVKPVLAESRRGQVEHISRRCSVGRNHFTCAFSPNAFISIQFLVHPEILTNIFCQPFQIVFFSIFFLLQFASLFTCYFGNYSLWSVFPWKTPSSSVLFPLLRLPFFCVQRLVSWNTFLSLFFPIFLSVQFHSILD